MDNATFTYNWRVTEFSLCAHKKGESIRSHSFEAQVLKKTTWTVLVYPRGYKDDSFVSVYLQRGAADNGPESVKLQVSFQLLASDGSQAQVQDLTLDFRRQNEFGCPEFISRKDLYLNADTYLQNGVLNIRCVLKLLEKHQFQTKHIFSSTTIPVERTNFDWQVKNFSKMTEEDKVSTPIILASETEPCFTAYLHLDREGGKDVVKIELQKSENPKRSTFILRCRMVVINAEGIESEFWSQHQHCFTSKEVWQFPTFLTRSNLLEGDQYLVDDVLTLRCEFTISSGKFNSKIDRTIRTAVDSSNNLSTSQLTLDMTKLYQEKEYADIQLQVSGERVPAHKAILESRSKKFSKMLEAFEKSEAKDSGILDVPDMDMDTLKNMLKYMYTEKVNDMSYNNAVKLYIVAQKYVIESLKYKCSLYLQHLLRVGNVCDILMLSDDYHDKGLKDAAVNFISHYWDEVFLSDEWVQLSKKRKPLARRMKEHLLAKRGYL